MKHVHVVINSFMNNFGILHQGIEVAGHRVFFHENPKMSVVDGEVFFNFDFMIGNGQEKVGESDAVAVVPSDRLFINRRYNKIEQALRINQFVDTQANKNKSSFSNFYKVRSWAHRQPYGVSHLVPAGGRVVVKPCDGARGIGQFLVDTTKIPLIVFVEALDLYREDRLSKEAFFAELDKYPEAYKYAVAGEKSEDEGLKALRSQDFVIQSFVDNVVAEYRLITDHNGDITYCQQRTIRKTDTGFSQATGSESNSLLASDVVPITDVLNKQSHKDLNQLGREVIGPLSSIDLFVTEDGKWGIFEYCNQFGIKGIPYPITLDLHKRFIEKLITGK